MVAAINAYRAIALRNYASFGMMQNMNAMTSLLGNVSFGAGYNEGMMNALVAKETAMECENLKYSLLYKAALAQEDTAKKLAKENIKRTFSIFA